MTKLKRLTLSLILCTCYLSLFAQYDTIHTIQVQGNIMEQTGGKTVAVGDTNLKIVGVGDFKTTGQGAFAFKLPILEFNRFDAEVAVKLKIANYEILRPLDGIFLVDTLDYDMIWDVLVIGKGADTNYRKQVTKLNKRLNKLKGENTLSQKRLNAMNDSLLNNIQRNEAQRAQLENTIADLETNLQSAESGNEALNAQLVAAQEALNSQQAQVDDLQIQLADAMEEKYLRQQQIYRAISADLKDYLIRTKDVHELVQNVGEYFPSSNNPEFSTTFNNTLKAYNGITGKINEEHKNYIQGVRNYWNNPQLAHQVEQTFEVLFHQLHYPKLQPAVSEIIGYIRINKKKKAMKLGHETFHNLNALIINLEKMIDKSLAALEDIE